MPTGDIEHRVGITSTITAFHHLPVVGKSRVLETFKVVLRGFRPAVPEIGALGLIAVEEAHDVLPIQLSLQINQADNIFGGFVLQLEDPVSCLPTM